uniref:AlNc14C11G1378 protein n=1 Tax=Albugo laibachii Nc14 TaxID=890382 RepID=F0W2Z9_9STRA|nr:AlNc14C11G1378 [Albugo laibachii Nc14]|eukprot:CCA15436.1 AlNc14C11G1378 [Albugo laibachii Nc14]
MDEQGSQANIYMVDQLTAMKWIKSCWREVPSEVILNFFRYTGIVLGRTTTRSSQIDADEQLNIRLLVHMKQLCIRDPMKLDDFICYANEVDIEMEAFTTADLLSIDGDVTLLSTAQDNSNDDDPAESGATVERVFSAHPAISIEDKLAAISAGKVTVVVKNKTKRVAFQGHLLKTILAGLVLSGQITFVLHIFDACGIEHASTKSCYDRCTALEFYARFCCPIYISFLHVPQKSPK